MTEQIIYSSSDEEFPSTIKLGSLSSSEDEGPILYNPPLATRQKRVKKRQQSKVDEERNKTSNSAQENQPRHKNNDVISISDKGQPAVETPHEKTDSQPILTNKKPAGGQQQTILTNEKAAGGEQQTILTNEDSTGGKHPILTNEDPSGAQQQTIVTN